VQVMTFGTSQASAPLDETAAMSKSSDSLLIVENGNGRTPVDRCAGPDELGHCSKVATGDVIPCAGRAIQARGKQGSEAWHLVVPTDSETCPLPAIQRVRRPVGWFAALLAMGGAVVGASIATFVTLVPFDRGTASSAPPVAAAPVVATTVRPVATVPQGAAAPLYSATQIPVTLSDYKVTLPSTVISAGSKSLEITNSGAMQHELLVFHPDASIDPGKLPVGPDGDVVEDAPGINKVSDGDNIDPGKSQTRALDLSTPGTYILLCNLPGHYKAGMWTRIDVVAATFSSTATLRDFRVDVPTTLQAGMYTFSIANAGAMQHELLVFHPDSSIDPTKLPLGSDGNVVEDAPGINKVSDGDNIDPGKSQTREVDLSAPGTYVFVCNLPGHYKLGMWTVVTVK
jgi:uncharacterized cupredoxin-like copper-binding protein